MCRQLKGQRTYAIVVKAGKNNSKIIKEAQDKSKFRFF